MGPKTGSMTSFLNEQGSVFYSVTRPLCLPVPSSQEIYIQLGAAIFNLLRGIPEKDYEKAFKDWIKRLRLTVYLSKEGLQ